ncbi:MULTISPECIES: toxic anion resistance protein [Marinobacter]|uniref:toxic anion resistance protein n=1 Tax=Marinobacter TaxID=2742 RepID=UPI000DAD5413|nr:MULTISPECIES: toxic anion resistance protein [Marinobacter]
MESQAVSMTESKAAGSAGLLDENNQLVAGQDGMDAEKQARIDELKNQIDLDDSQSIIVFGSAQQSRMAALSKDMIGGVKNKDAGPAGALLNDMLVQVRGLDTSDLKDGKSPGFFRKLFGAIEPLAKFIQQFESIESQVNAIERKLEKEIMTLSKDVGMLEKLYDGVVEHYEELEYFIAAGEVRLKEVNEVEIPKLQADAEASDDMMAAQRLREVQAAATDLERKVHDLKLTRQTTMQFLPTIMMTQENDKALINKMNSSLVNTLSLWHVQIAQSIAMANTRNAAETQKAVSDMNNQLLEANATNLKESNAAVRKEMERGIFDIESIEKSNQTLIDAINESLQLAQEGREKRADAEQRLVQCESSLKEALRSN